MKYDYNYFHKALLRLQCVKYAEYSEYEEIDLLFDYIGEEKILDYDTIEWTDFREDLVYHYERGNNEAIVAGKRKNDVDKIIVGNELEVLTNRIESLEICIRFLIYLRDNTHKIFDKPTIGIEDFETEIARLISDNLENVTEKKLHKALLELIQQGIENPAEKAESELEALRKTNKDLEKANSQLKNDLDALKKQYDELKTLWDNRNKRKKPVQYGISSDFQNDESQWVIDQLIRHDYVYIGRLFHGEDVYVWKKSKSLFAFFVDRFTEQFNLRDTNEQIPWHLFEGVFVGSNGMDVSFYKGLKDLVSKYRKSGKIPQNDDVIERILKEAKTKPWLKDTTNPK